MLVLGIDTSTPMVSVALADDEHVVGRQSRLANNAHGELLSVLIDVVLRDAGATPSDLTALTVGLGPGPFTGLRVGIMTAAAMSDALGVPAFGECSLDVVGCDPALSGDAFAVITDARRRQVYWAVYGDAGDRIEGPDLAPPVEVAESLRGRVRTVVGPGASLYAQSFAGFHVAETRWPDAGALAVAGVRRLACDAVSEPLTPMYLRRPDAREPGAAKRVTPS